MADPLDLYRPNVGVVLFHPDGRVWLGRRTGASGPYNWQFPQGGVDKGETLEDAARRELAEETGVRRVTQMARTDGWIVYDFPPGHGGPKAYRGWKGQKQVWFAFRFDGAEDEINLDVQQPPEFDAWRWGYLAETPAVVVPFKRRAYEDIVTAFSSFAAPPAHG